MRKITAVGVDITKDGRTQVVTFEVTRHDDGTLTVELSERKPISHAKTKRQVTTEETCPEDPGEEQQGAT